MATSTQAPGTTFFDRLRRSFTDVPIDPDNANAIATTEFLEAAESLTTLFDVLGSVAFTPVKSDMLGNIKVRALLSLGISSGEKTHGLIIINGAQKIRDRQLAAPGDSQDLRSLVVNELKTKKHTAAEGLLWLVRGLDFTAKALRQNVAVSNEELSTSFRNAYSTTLKQHHSFLVKPIFSAAMSATPYRKDFYAKLGDDLDKVQHELRLWLSALEKQVGILRGFQERKEAKW